MALRETMKTTLELLDELMRELKTRAAVHGRKLKDVVAEALRTGLMLAGPVDAPAGGVRVETDPETGLPVVITVADAPGALMSREEIKRLEQDAQYQEDLRRGGLPV